MTEAERLVRELGAALLAVDAARAEAQATLKAITVPTGLRGIASEEAHKAHSYAVRAHGNRKYAASVVQSKVLRLARKLAQEATK